MPSFPWDCRKYTLQTNGCEAQCQKNKDNFFVIKAMAGRNGKNMGEFGEEKVEPNKIEQD